MGKDREQANPTQWMIALVGLLLACGVAWGLGYLQARETEHRHHTPRAYQEGAKASAERTCKGLDAADMFECVNDRVEAATDRAQAEQDLSAQQRAATSALIAAIVGLITLGVSVAGVWFVKRTLDATLEAVEDTGLATRAMQEANVLADRNARQQLRAYVGIRGAEFEFGPDGYPQFINVKATNAGQTPAFKFRSAGAVVFVREPEKLAAQFDGQYANMATESVVGPGASVKYTIYVGNTPKHRWGDFDAGMPVLLIVRCDYEDAFGTARWTTARRQLRRKPGGGFMLIPCAEGNGAN